MKRITLFLIGFMLIFSSLRADEGMWLPFLIQKLNMQKMQEMGLQLSAEEIYSINSASLKDAVVALDFGSCTAELISREGLILTNHHCGYGEIQAHSSVEHDYLTNGFWAMTKAEELPNPGKTATFLISIEDVSKQINDRLSSNMTEDEREYAIKVASEQLVAEAKLAKPHYEAAVHSFFNGNNFYLYITETFLDVRLVGAPPESIGKFGHDTDNWVWPRHTGDFSMFRIYCAPDGTPAEYSENNIPYTPRHHFPISIAGVEKGDFAMIFGYPGSTDRYLTSWGVKNTMEISNTIRIKVRTEKLDIMKEGMNKSDKTRIQYASKHARSANYWKYSIGQNRGLEKLNVIEKKQATEKKLSEWINANAARKNQYGETLEMIEKAYTGLNEYDVATNYWFEALYQGAEVLRHSLGLRQLAAVLEQNDQEAINKITTALKENAEEFYKDYDIDIDKKLMSSLYQIYYSDVKKEYHPDIFATVEKKYKGSFEKYAEKLFATSMFPNKEKYLAFLNKPDLKTLQKDMGFQNMESLLNIYISLSAKTKELNAQLEKGRRLFVKAFTEMEADRSHYPDANSTMRLTYGTVGDYSPADGILYKHYTTLDGYLEKEDPTNPEFIVTEKLKNLYYTKDFGPYGQDGEMRVCFTTNNDITGGNSGSPVINSKGHIIGCAFDGNWEAMSGDIAFEPELQKCINVDIRFVLFVIDKVAGAGHLVKEMTIVKEEVEPVETIEQSSIESIEKEKVTETK